MEDPKSSSLKGIPRSSSVAFEARKAVDRDAFEICNLLFKLKTQYGSCTEKTAHEFESSYVSTVIDAIDQQTNSIWIAVNETGKIIGFISMTRRLVPRLAGHVGVMEEIFVEPDYRRKGVGTALWNSAISELRLTGVQMVEVVTSLAHPGQRQFANSIGLEWYSNIHRVKI